MKTISLALSGNRRGTSLPILTVAFVAATTVACASPSPDQTGTGGKTVGTGGASGGGTGGGAGPGTGGTGAGGGPPSGMGGMSGTGGTPTGAGGNGAGGGPPSGMGGRGTGGGQAGAPGSGGGTITGACPANATFCSGFEDANQPATSVYNVQGAPGAWTRDFAPF